MKLSILSLFLAAFCSVSCFQPDDSGPPRGGRSEGAFSCERFTSCDTCTPVLGCGWCQAGDKGICAADPDQCAQVASFSWTWERAFCPAEADAGADGATEAKASDAGATGTPDASDAPTEHGAD
jgi:Plexin repeat